MPAKYRADHIGSLLRPAELLQARSASVDTAQLRALEDKHILTVLERQRDLGFKIFTDGEFRRGNFMSDFNEAVEGIDEGVAVARTWQTGAGASPRPSMVPGTVVSKIKQTRRLTEHEFAFAKQHSPGDVKVTLPTANQFPAIYYKKGISDKVYPNHSAFLWDIVPVIKAEIQALASEGARYVQIDAPRYSYYIDPKWRSYVKTEMGLDPDQALDEAIRADNACLEGANRQGVTSGDSSLPRQQSQPVVRRRRLRCHRRETVRPAQRRRVSARVRVRARRQLRTLALRASRQDRRAWTRKQQAAGVGIARSSRQKDRRSEPLRAAGKPGDQPSVRLRLDDGRKLADRRPAMAKVETSRRYRCEGLGRGVVA